jgi:pseudouridine synthase
VPLYKYLIKANVSSRRKCIQAIKNGQVKVNGNIVKDPLCKIKYGQDIVYFKGKIINKNKLKTKYIYYLINKPAGFISTVKDTHKRKKVVDIIKSDERIYPVGRLDKDTTGALILTNDGQLTHRLIHPKFKIEKEYEVEVSPKIDKKDLKKLETGVIIDKSEKVKAKTKIIKQQDKKTIVKLVIHKGIKRQIKKMFSRIGYQVVNLKRERIGNIVIGDLKQGQYRKLTKDEINTLKKMAGLNEQ